jgi:hypothetical protein
MNHLASCGDATDFDFVAEALKFCRQRGYQELTQASVIDRPYSAGLPFGLTVIALARRDAAPSRDM